MKISKIIYDNGEESEYNELPIEHFEKIGVRSPFWKFHEQREKWEKQNILNYLQTDLEDWAKDEYDLVDESEVKSLDDYDDYDIKEEYKDRGLGKESSSYAENILNEDFKDRFFEIVNRGNPEDIDLVLEMLEKKFRII